MEKRTAVVVHIISRWSSCGCLDCGCFLDMCEVLLSNGEEAITTYVTVGTTLYFHREDQSWYHFPEEEEEVDSCDDVWDYSYLYSDEEE